MINNLYFRYSELGEFVAVLRDYSPAWPSHFQKWMSELLDSFSESYVAEYLLTQDEIYEKILFAGSVQEIPVILHNLILTRLIEGCKPLASQHFDVLYDDFVLISREYEALKHKSLGYKVKNWKRVRSIRKSYKRQNKNLFLQDMINLLCGKYVEGKEEFLAILSGMKKES